MLAAPGSVQPRPRASQGLTLVETDRAFRSDYAVRLALALSDIPLAHHDDDRAPGKCPQVPEAPSCARAEPEGALRNQKGDRHGLRPPVGPARREDAVTPRQELGKSLRVERLLFGPAAEHRAARRAEARSLKRE